MSRTMNGLLLFGLIGTTASPASGSGWRRVPAQTCTVNASWQTTYAFDVDGFRNWATAPAPGLVHFDTVDRETAFLVCPLKEDDLHPFMQMNWLALDGYDNRIDGAVLAQVCSFAADGEHFACTAPKGSSNPGPGGVGMPPWYQGNFYIGMSGGDLAAVKDSAAFPWARGYSVVVAAVPPAEGNLAALVRGYFVSYGN